MRYIILSILLVACSSKEVPGIPFSTRTSDIASGYTVLHTFSQEDGFAVRGALVELNGRLYGLAGEMGPNADINCSSTANWPTPIHTRHCPGSLFSLKLDGTDFKVEHAFSVLDINNRNLDGYHPYGTLAVGPDHRLYGVTQGGGSPIIEEAPEVTIPGYGVLFAYDPVTGVFTILHNFFSKLRALDGEYPMGSVAIDPSGNVFGIAKEAGATLVGTLWKWSPLGTFSYAPLPGFTYGGISFGNGMIHGTTWIGGINSKGAYFTANPYTLESTIIDSFPDYTMNEHGTDNTPIQEPAILSNGQVIMAREFGGPFGSGIVVSLDPNLGINLLKSMDDIPLNAVPRFSNTTGGMPNGRMAEGPDGFMYGVVQYGGARGTGGIFRIARNGAFFQLLYSFDEDAYPYGGVLIGSDGAVYGTTFNTGRIWRFVPPQTLPCQ